MTRRRFGDVRITRPRVERYGLGRSVETCAPVTTSGQRIRVCISRPEKPGAVISDYSQVCRVLRHAVSADRESLYALHLDRQNRLIGVEEVARGTIGSVETSPREVFKAAILSNAAALILAHNHPSGQPFPSQDDFNITDKLVAVGRLLGIPVHDHVIVAAEGCVSIRETRPAGFGGARRRRRVVPGVGSHPERRRPTDDLGFPDWWRTGRVPRRATRCYTTKGEALKAFVDANDDVIGPWGGLTKTGSRGEFDSINERYGLRGRKRATSIADALWVAMPVGRPFCLDRIDLDSLNETTPARVALFRLPYEVQEEIAIEKYGRRGVFGVEDAGLGGAGWTIAAIGVALAALAGALVIHARR